VLSRFLANHLGETYHSRERSTEGARRVKPDKQSNLSDGLRSAGEFVFRQGDLQFAKYLTRVANVDRETPESRASFATIHMPATSPFIAESDFAMNGSARPESRPLVVRFQPHHSLCNNSRRISSIRRLTTRSLPVLDADLLHRSCWGGTQASTDLLVS